MDDIKILVVEDDREINQLVTGHLKKEGYGVDSAYNGREALDFLAAGAYHMAVLDLMVPQVDGYEILRRIREKTGMPVLILSARSEETDKVIGLGLGADDYMTKPFGKAELIARVKAQLRRYLHFGSNRDMENSILRHMDLELDLSTYGLRIAGRPVALTAKEFDILKLFMMNPKRVFTKSQIFNSVWEGDFICDDNTVMVHIRRLREKIEPDPSNPTYLQTVWGIGYKLSEV